MATVDQPTANPSDKLTASTLGAALGPLLYALAAAKWPLLQKPEIAVPLLPLLSSVIAFAPGYLKREHDEFSKRIHANRNWKVLAGGAAVLIVGGFFAYKMIV